MHPTQMKIFGFVICPTLYQETVTKPGIELYEDLRKCCFHGNPGSLTVEVAKIFALSKLYYVAQVLPLPDKQRRRVESCLSKFIFIGSWRTGPCRVDLACLGGFLSNTGLGENFPELADLGPVSHTMSKNYPLHQYMHDTFVEAISRGEVKKDKLKGATTKGTYKSRTADLLPSLVH